MLIANVIALAAGSTGIAHATPALTTPNSCPFPPTLENCRPQVREALQEAHDATNVSSIGPNGVTYTVGGTCAGKAGVSTSFESPTTWAVTAEGHAASSSPLVRPLATGVVCHVKDATTAAEYGLIDGGTPGGQAVAAGTMQIPAGALVTVCVVISATFSDGFTSTSGNC